MKRSLIVCALVLVFCCVSFGQGGSDAPASKEDIERYLGAMHSHEMMKQMLAAMTKPMHQMVHDQYLKDKDKLPENFEATVNTSMDDMMAEMPFDEMMDAMAPIMRKSMDKVQERMQEQVAQMIKNYQKQPADAATPAQN